MVSTPELVAALVARAEPVRRLRPPLQRAAVWLLVAALVLLALGVLNGPRPDLSERLRQPIFTVMLLASLSTGILAAIAAFHLSLPDRSRRCLWLPVPALVLWASTIGVGCLTNWVRIGPGTLTFGTTVECLATVMMTSLPLSVILVLMLRHAARLDPVAVAVTGGLAVASIAATAVSVLHPLEATVLVLLWSLGLAALTVALAVRYGPRLLGWAETRSSSD
jgi:hypothetical protein